MAKIGNIFSTASTSITSFRDTLPPEAKAAFPNHDNDTGKVLAVADDPKVFDVVVRVVVDDDWWDWDKDDGDDIIVDSTFVFVLLDCSYLSLPMIVSSVVLL